LQRQHTSGQRGDLLHPGCRAHSRQVGTADRVGRVNEAAACRAQATAGAGA
jgi:hypothetical protein